VHEAIRSRTVVSGLRKFTPMPKPDTPTSSLKQPLGVSGIAKIVSEQEYFTWTESGIYMIVNINMINTTVPEQT
jgi:hypothetical protein